VRFNRDAVVVPTDPGQPFANAPRNSVRAPFFWQVDMAVLKRVPLGGSSTIELRAEFFNLFNRANFRAPNANRSAGGIWNDYTDLRSAAGAARRQSLVLSLSAISWRNDEGDVFRKTPRDRRDGSS
jgi:hypothetical protein